MKNILIIGVGRSGKTTLSKMLKDKNNSYNLIHGDSLKWGIIRSEGKENYYRNNIDKQNEFEHGEFFQKTLLEFFNSLSREDNKQYGYILESGQLHPKYVNEMIDFDNTIVVCLGLGNLSVDEIIELCIEHDNESDWSYGLPKDQLRQHAENWYRFNNILKSQCLKYGIEYYDTSNNRIDVLNRVLDYIKEKNDSK